MLMAYIDKKIPISFVWSEMTHEINKGKTTKLGKWKKGFPFHIQKGIRMWIPCEKSKWRRLNYMFSALIPTGDSNSKYPMVIGGRERLVKVQRSQII